MSFSRFRLLLQGLLYLTLASLPLSDWSRAHYRLGLMALTVATAVRVLLSGLVPCVVVVFWLAVGSRRYYERPTADAHRAERA